MWHETSNDFRQTQNQEVVRRHQRENEFMVKFDDVSGPAYPSDVQDTLHQQYVIFCYQWHTFDRLCHNFTQLFILNIDEITLDSKYVAI